MNQRPGAVEADPYAPWNQSGPVGPSPRLRCH
jgi:hypothetical protein